MVRVRTKIRLRLESRLGLGSGLWVSGRDRCKMSGRAISMLLLSYTGHCGTFGRFS